MGSVKRSSCEHSVCDPDEIEERAAAILTRLVNDDGFVRVCEVEPRGIAKPDYRSEDHAMEVKQLISPAVKSFNDAHRRHLGRMHYPVASLSRTWAVMPGVSEAFESSDPGTPTPAAKKLVKRLVPLFEDLERKGVTNAIHSDGIARLIHSRFGCSVIPNSPFDPGIVFMGASFSSTRTMDIEIDVVEFLQKWITSEQAHNMLDSLREERGKRCAVVIATGDYAPAWSMIRTLSDGEPDAVPKTELRLPPEIDTLVLIAGNHVLHYDLSTEWRRRTIESLGIG